ncbi:MAG: hypothetical protein WB791_04030 [Waddliaceae bacterium]
MLVGDQIKKLLKELAKADFAKIDFSGSTITVEVVDRGSRLSFSTPVYFGGNFIPKSVRGCVEQTAPFDQVSIRTSLVIDEENYQIFLRYLGKVENLTNVKFIDLLEDFSWLAEKWREHLDDHDKNDLVYIPIK